MTIKITTDKGSEGKLPDAIGFLHRYIDRGNKTGKVNGRLDVQQHGGFEYRFFIWHTKLVYFVEITSSVYTNFD